MGSSGINALNSMGATKNPDCVLSYECKRLRSKHAKECSSQGTAWMTMTTGAECAIYKSQAFNECCDENPECCGSVVKTPKCGSDDLRYVCWPTWKEYWGNDGSTTWERLVGLG